VITGNLTLVTFPQCQAITQMRGETCLAAAPFKTKL